MVYFFMSFSKVLKYVMPQTSVAFCDDEDPSLLGVYELTCLKWVILTCSLMCLQSGVYWDFSPQKKFLGEKKTLITSAEEVWRRKRILFLKCL